MKCRVLCVCLSVFVFVSVWEGDDNWLRKVTVKHGSSFVPCSAPSVGWENGGKWRNSEAQRRAASVGVRNKIVCKGMRSYTEEGGGEGLQSKEKSSKGAADGLGFCSYGIVRGRLG